jgi:methylglutamate dehydrogenase subunit C
MRGPARVAEGLLTDPARPIRFRFDGRLLEGLAGDTLASALLANGRRLVGRSFKYHRPRGIFTAGPEEPCALVDVLGEAGREPNCLATTLPLREDLVAESQNCWPSLPFDFLALNDLLAPFLPAGFYYKTFMAPGWAWERIYEPLIRRAAGLGRIEPRVPARTAPAETVHDHTDVLVVGAGPAGLAAAHRLGRCGLRVMLLEQDGILGGGALLDPRWQEQRERTAAALTTFDGLRCLPRTTVIGAYGHGVFGALETLTPPESKLFGGMRERLRVIRARSVIFATGAVERLVAFPDNDRPGVMLAGAALGYLRRYGVAVGRRPLLFVNNDEAYESAFALCSAGVECAGIVDVRAESLAADRARALGLEVQPGAIIEGVRGRRSIHAVRVARLDGGRRRELAADCVLLSGGHSPLTALASQLGGRARWEDRLAAFTVESLPPGAHLAGAARGVFGLAAAWRDGDATAREVAARLRACAAPGEEPAGVAAIIPADREVTPIEPVWEVRAPGKAFVDLQNDVTTADVRLACREGYEHIEHMKRFTTHSMATDQGRIGGLVGSAVLAQARGVPLSAVGQPSPRPYSRPVPFGALAGAEVRDHFKPKRRLPLHDWHESAGATFVSTGLWLRPLVYARGGGWEAVLEEARTVRRAVGITDLSTLGKIDVQGADAARFLDFIYANTFSTLAVGRCRYGIMLREDGMLLDDGTTSRLAPTRFLVTTTTANAAATLEHMEFYLQSTCAGLDVMLTDVTEHWAQFALAGPRAREVLAKVVAGIDLANAAFPFMAAADAVIAGVPGRVFRISFSGELAYELAVPGSHALHVWRTTLTAGEPYGIRPYGLDALNTLRIEKGHVTGAELNGNTTASDLGFERMMKKEGDFVGRVLSRRPALSSPARLQLVGVRPVERRARLRNGSHLIEQRGDGASLGYVTSATPGVELEGWVGLALLEGGRRRIGTRLTAAAPVHREHVEVEIVSPHMLDPENGRVRG